MFHRISISNEAYDILSEVAEIWNEPVSKLMDKIASQLKTRELAYLEDPEYKRLASQESIENAIEEVLDMIHANSENAVKEAINVLHANSG